MKLENLLSQKKSIVLKKWFYLILETYPADTSRFLKKEKNPFANPVGHTISKEMEALYEELIRGMDYDKVSPFLDNIIRIRAIQNFSPSRAIAFVFLLKKVIRDELGKEIKENRLFEKLVEFESRVDELALLSFDIYMKCREKLYEIRANEVRNRSFRLLERANLVLQDPKSE
ncbi:MAG: RsbRD N-terminal domain-containing protein [Deltaproteobacteria bacterium]|nr:RsbRD N-terminal domain-containing protein [Deltaproteobacteria bacterium]MBW2305913.1 RsbRD N-terminal domain-containing protein [Deltaproteobacteria bacterium]